MIDDLVCKLNHGISVEVRVSMAAIRILIVDDNRSFIRGLQRFLNKHNGLQVVGEAETAAYAQRKLEQIEVDVATIDLMLPDMSGLQLLSFVRKKYPHIVCVVVSMHNSKEYRDAALSAGAHAFVSKSDVSKSLLEAIHSAPHSDFDKG
jgi:DNA-binding NarL/FixJ family response regulator